MGIPNAQILLRVLTVNIQAGSSTRRYSDYITRSWSHALPMGRKRKSLDTIAHVASMHDIVGIQESDPGSLRSGFINQAHYLARRGQFNYWTHQPNRKMALVASSANALLSHHAPVRSQTYALPGRIGGRGILLAQYGHHRTQSLMVAVTHLSLGTHSRKMQLAFIAKLLHSYPNLILMGDFNCTADHEDMHLLYQQTALKPPEYQCPTFPSWQPKRAIDHILISPSLTICHTHAIQAAFSDHLALSTELLLPRHLMR